MALFKQLSDLMKLQGNPKTMITFCDHFLACIVGKVEWKQKVTKNLIKEIVTNSDEGFALLVLENTWDEWSKFDAKEFFFAKHKTIKVTNKNKQEVDGGLHIQRVLQDLVDGMLMESRDSMSYVLLLLKIVKTIVVSILIISIQ